MGEHLLCKQGVVGSIPSSSTIKPVNIQAPVRCLSIGVANRSLLGFRLFFNNS